MRILYLPSVCTPAGQARAAVVNPKLIIRIAAFREGLTEELSKPPAAALIKSLPLKSIHSSISYVARINEFFMKGLWWILSFVKSIVITIPISLLVSSRHSSLFRTRLILKPASISHYRASLLADKINKYVYMSKIKPLCPCVLASQLSHDYTQDAYRQLRHSFALKPGYQNINWGPKPC